jgi:outer membrane protein W
MKKLLLIIAVVIISTSAFAQNKGDKYLMAGASASFGTMKMSVTNGNQSVNSTEPMNTTFGLQVGYGLFAADNIRFELGVGVSYQSEPTTQSGNLWLHNKTMMAELCPNVSYYLKITDKFYYTPEVGVSLIMGSTENEQSVSQSTKYKTYGLGVYGNLCAFEFRATDKVALGVNVGYLHFLHLKMPNAVNNLDVIGNEIGFNLNNLSVVARFYL